MTTDQHSILIVDDDPDLRQLIALHLNARGYPTIEASNGREALEIIHDHLDLALVLLDLRMPEVNGLDVLEQMRRGPAHDVPTVVLTGDRDAAREALAAGARGFLLKPIEAKPLLEQVRTHSRYQA
jgi:CheY-like chemotaxis protein